MNSEKTDRSFIVAGADVTKGSWVVVVLEDGSFKEVVVIDRLLDPCNDIQLLALDIPIGLPEGGGDWPRPADLEARAFVGPRWPSVFIAPPRPVYDAQTYSAANALHRKLTTKGLSRQTWALRAKILETESFLNDHPITIEVHPEVCFRAMKGDPLESSKKTWDGQMERRALLAAQGIELPDHLDGPAGKVPPDDLLDAAAAAWTAWRCVNGSGRALPESDGGRSLSDSGVIWL